MPLVVPGITQKEGTTTTTAGTSSSKGKDNTNGAWMNKLMGKKLTDGATDENSFSRKDLPERHRVVDHGGFMTQDHVPDRLNVHLGPDGTVMKTAFDDGRS